ncbi:hypothetical protein ES707_12524 [subsurface metagenome]
MKTLAEAGKYDIGLVSQALNNTNKTGKWYSMAGFRRALALLSGGPMAVTKTTKIELLQASDVGGTGSKGIPTTPAQAVLAEITSNTKVTELTITLATVLADETITINGLIFTAHGTVTTPANREFSISGNDEADAGELVTCINDPTYGVPGISASNAVAVITLISAAPGEKLLTVASSDATFTIGTTKAQAFVEVNTSRLDINNGFAFIAIKVTTTANSHVAALLQRGEARFTAQQQMAASKIY